MSFEVFFILFVAFADAAAIFPNATTTSGTSKVSSVTITSAPSAAPSIQTTSWGIIAYSYYWCESNMQFCSRPGWPAYSDHQLLDQNPFAKYTTETGALAAADSTCAQVYESQLTDWLWTAPITAVETDPAIMDGPSAVETQIITGLGISTCAGGSCEVTTWTATQTETVPTETKIPPWTYNYYASSFTYTAASPCCSSCTIFGGNVQVFAWPTPAPTPAVSTLVDASNFTFISPSIYVAFNSLYATDLCGTVGTEVNSATTIAFAPNALSTAISYNYTLTNGMPMMPTTFEAADYGASKTCINITTSFYQALGYSSIFSNLAAASSFLPSDVFTVHPTNNGFVDPPVTINYGAADLQSGSQIELYTVTYNPCSPYLSVPTQLYNLSTLWTGCVHSISAYYDPPYTLSSGSGMVPFGTVTTSSSEYNPSETPNTPYTLNPATGVPSFLGPSNSPPTTTISAVAGSSPIVDQPTQTAPPNVYPTTTLKIQPPGTDDPPTQAPSSPGNGPSASSVDPTETLSIVVASLLSPSSPGSDPPPSSSLPDPMPQSSTPPAILTLGPSIITANPSSVFTIGSQILSPGGQITVSGTVLSLFSSGNSIVIGSSTTQLLIPPSPSPTYIIGSQTLSPGAPPITFSGTQYSLQPDGSSVIIGTPGGQGSTAALTALLTPTGTPEFELGSQTLVAGGSVLTIQEQVVTSVSGSAVTFSKTEVVSLESGGASVVISAPGAGESTEALSALLGSTTTRLGQVIQTIGGFGPGVASSTGGGGYSGTVFAGEGIRERGERGIWVVGMMVGIVGLVLWL